MDFDEWSFVINNSPCFVADKHTRHVSGDVMFYCPLMLLQLAGRCQEIIPRVLLCLNKVVQKFSVSAVCMLAFLDYNSCICVDVTLYVCSNPVVTENM